MTTTHDWTGRTGDVWADEWRRTDRCFGDLARQLDAAILAAAPTGPFRALDIGSGAGATSLALAAARPDAEVTGIDLSTALVATARERAAGRGNCRFEQGDVLAAAASVHPDLLFSRHGVMFFADPVAAFTQLRQAAAPGASLVFSCFGARTANRFATLADEVAAGSPPPPVSTAPGPFAFAEQDHVWAMLTQAGWQPEAAAKVEFAYRVGEGPDAIGDAVSFMARIGPAAIALSQSADPSAMRAALADQLAPYHVDNSVDLPATAWIWRARAGESA